MTRPRWVNISVTTFSPLTRIDSLAASLMSPNTWTLILTLTKKMTKSLHTSPMNSLTEFWHQCQLSFSPQLKSSNLITLTHSLITHSLTHSFTARGPGGPQGHCRTPRYLHPPSLTVFCVSRTRFVAHSSPLHNIALPPSSMSASRPLTIKCSLKDRLRQATGFISRNYQFYPIV